MVKSIKLLFKIYKGCKAEESSKIEADRYIQIEDLRNDFNMKYAIRSPKNVLCKKEDILIAWDGANAGTIGYGLEGVIGSTIAKLVPFTNEISTEYCGRFLQAKFKFLRENCTGATIPHISRPSLESLQIPLPPLVTQKKIAAILDAADAYRQKTKTLIQKYDLLAQSLFLDMFGDPKINKNEYKEYTFNSIANQITDGDHLTPDREDSGYKLLSCRNIKNGFIDFTTGLDYVGESEFQRMTKRCKPERNDILISCSGTIGRTTVIKTDEPFVLVRSAALVKLKKDFVNPYYIEFYLRTSYMQSVMMRSANTSSQSNLFTGPIKNLPILVPPITLQNQFAESIQLIEAQKQQAQASLQKAENLFNSLLQRAFKGELVAE